LFIPEPEKIIFGSGKIFAEIPTPDEGGAPHRFYDS